MKMKIQNLQGDWTSQGYVHFMCYVLWEKNTHTHV